MAVINSESILRYRFLLIPYVTVCAGIFHMTYWNQFNLNGLEIVSVSELIKSSVMAVLRAANTGVFSVLGLIIAHQYFIKFDKKKKDADGNDYKEFTKTNYIFSMAVLLLIAYISDLIHNEDGILFTIIYGVTVTIEKWFLNIPRTYRQAIIFIIMYIPFNTLITAFKDARLIINENEYQYIIKDSVKYKYLGSNDTYFICMKKGDTKIEFIRLDLLGSYTLHHYCRPIPKGNQFFNFH